MSKNIKDQDNKGKRSSLSESEKIEKGVYNAKVNLMKVHATTASLIRTAKKITILTAVGFGVYGTHMWNKARDEGNRNRSVPTEKSVRESVNEVVQDFKENQEDTLKITDFSQKNDNILLEKLDGKKVGDWAQALEDNLGLAIDADIWRDIGNGTQEHSTKSEQDMILSVMGGKDASGNQNITRDDVIEVKETYEADSLSHKTSFNQSDFDVNSSDMGVSVKGVAIGMVPQATTLTV